MVEVYGGSVWWKRKRMVEAYGGSVWWKRKRMVEAYGGSVSVWWKRMVEAYPAKMKRCVIGQDKCVQLRSQPETRPSCGPRIAQASAKKP
jgi:hypothetical protein